MGNNNYPEEIESSTTGCLYAYFGSNGPHKKLYQRLFAAGFVVGVMIISAIFMLLTFCITRLFHHIITPSSIRFQLHSFNYNASSPTKVTGVAVFSVENPLDYSVYVDIAKASISHRDQLLGFKLMDPFRVMGNQEKVLSAGLDLPAAVRIFGGGDGDGGVVGFEFRVDGLVKIRDGDDGERIGSIKVICGRFEVLFSSDSTAAGELVGGTRDCRSSWEYF